MLSTAILPDRCVLPPCCCSSPRLLAARVGPELGAPRRDAGPDPRRQHLRLVRPRGLAYDETSSARSTTSAGTSSGRGVVRTQHGMLTLNTATQRQRLRAADHGRPRVRPLGDPPRGSGSTATGTRRTRVRTELVPAGEGGRGLRRAEHRAQQASRSATTGSTSTSTTAPTTSFRALDERAASVMTIGTPSRSRSPASTSRGSSTSHVVRTETPARGVLRPSRSTVRFSHGGRPAASR